MTKFPLENLKHHKVEEGIYKLVGDNAPFNNKYEWIHHSYKGSFDPHELEDITPDQVIVNDGTITQLLEKIYG